jgi:hypothetical protein
MLVGRLLYSFDISSCDLIPDFAGHDRSLCSVEDNIRSIADKKRLDVQRTRSCNGTYFLRAFLAASMRASGPSVELT